MIPEVRLSLSNSARSTNAVVAKAMNATDADWSRRGKVTAQTDTLFGRRNETKVMAQGELRDNLTRAGHGRLLAGA